MLSELQDKFHEALIEAIQEKIERDGSYDEQVILEAIGPTIEKIRPRIAKVLLRTLKRDAPRMLKERRGDRAGFEGRNLKRWKGAFNLYEMLLVILAEVGGEHDKQLRPDAIKSDDFRFEALSHIFPKALLIGEEILCLLQGGFADGALSRWRTLYELTVVAQFIKSSDQTTALRYLANFDFQASKAAKECNAFAGGAGFEPYTLEELRGLEARATALEHQIGSRLRTDYDWAHPALLSHFPSLKPQSVTFRQIEEAVGMDFWRPYYRWANVHVHAGHRPHDSLLGVCESVETVALIGPSNSGFVDPLQFAAISLVHIAIAFLFLKPNIDRLIISDVLIAISDEIAPLAMKLERETLEVARKQESY